MISTRLTVGNTNHDERDKVSGSRPYTSITNVRADCGPSKLTAKRVYDWTQSDWL